jgi:hypothetical protein
MQRLRMTDGGIVGPSVILLDQVTSGQQIFGPVQCAMYVRTLANMYYILNSSIIV